MAYLDGLTILRDENVLAILEVIIGLAKNNPPVWISVSEQALLAVLLEESFEPTPRGVGVDSLAVEEVASIFSLVHISSVR